MTLHSLYKQNRYFFISYFVLLIFGIFILLTYSKPDGFILMNPWHHRPLDYFFRAVTYLGDGWFVTALAIALFLFKKRFLSLMVLASYALSGLTVQLIKRLFDSPRPVLFMEGSGYSSFVEGVTLHNYNSFPSGHTATAFAIAAILAFAAKNKNVSFLYLMIAALVGYSRIYLGQHFMEDVLSGSIIAIVGAIICWLFLSKWIGKITGQGIIS